MSNLTHTTAVVVIPPAEVWLPIQALRQQHDRQHRRWMLHITMYCARKPLALAVGRKRALLSCCIGVPIATLHDATMPVADPRLPTQRGGDIE
jgi:hypothetical protein